MLNLATTLLALWLILLGVAQGKSVYTAEPPLGNFSVKFSKVSEFLPPATPANTRSFDRLNYKCASGGSYDGTGHVVALTDINKNLLATYQYGPFGEKISAQGPRANSNPWRYATKYLDEEIGLYYYGHRYYDPITGQWLSREPLGESESVNLYSYCHNDPVNHVDVLGLREKDIISGDAGNRFRRNANGEWEVRIVTVETGFWGNKSDYVSEQWQSVSTGQNRLRLLGYAGFDEGGGQTTAGSDYIQAASVATGWDENSMKEGTIGAAIAIPSLVVAPMAIGYGIVAAPAAYFWAMANPGTTYVAGDLIYTGAEIGFGIEGPGPVITPADSLRAVPKAAQYVDELFDEMRHLELGWPAKMRQLSDSGVPLNMAVRRALSPGETMIGFMRPDGTLVGSLAHPRVGHDLLASQLGLAGAANRGDVIAFTVGKSSSGEIRGFGSGTFPPPGGIMDDRVRSLVQALFE